MKVCNLTELDFEGYRYTWSNGRKDNENIQSRLDRVHINPTFMEMFPGSKVSHLPRFGSDHAAIRIEFGDQELNDTTRRKHLFRFEEAWLKDSHCEEMVKRCWMETGSNVWKKLFSLQGLQASFKEYRTEAISKEIKRVERMMQKYSCWLSDSQSIENHRALERP